jgi:two-component system, LytTR family, response regulator
MRIIIIDDEHFNRELIAMLIRRYSPSAEIVAEEKSLRGGFRVITELDPDVVFLDIKMPDGTGFDLLRMFNAPRFEVVFVTGFDEYTEKASLFNAYDYVLKPIDLEKFEQTIKGVQARVLNRKKRA